MLPSKFIWNYNRKRNDDLMQWKAWSKKKHDNWFIFTFFSKSDREVNTLLPLFDICGDKTNIKVEMMWVYFVQKLIISSRWFSLIKFHFGLIWPLFFSKWVSHVIKCDTARNCKICTQDLAQFWTLRFHLSSIEIYEEPLDWSLATPWSVQNRNLTSNIEQMSKFEKSKEENCILLYFLYKFTHILASDKS